MAERPILFSGEMVRAILDGSKTQTRRVVKLPGDADRIEHHGDEWVAIWDIDPMHPLDHGGEPYTETLAVRCPYGQPGDLLWVRERQRVLATGDFPPNEKPGLIRVRYEADDAESDWLPYPARLKGTPVVGKCLAYGGYRESSRLTLRVTDVRVERVQYITPADIRAEGVELPEEPRLQYIGMGHEAEGRTYGYWVQDARRRWETLWNSINGQREGCSWEANPWVWAITFERVK